VQRRAGRRVREMGATERPCRRLFPPASSLPANGGSSGAEEEGRCWVHMLG
jgi:hypothetical protein